jgi:hypothetical protein
MHLCRDLFETATTTGFCHLLQDMNVSLVAHMLENLGPYGDAHFSRVCFLQNSHLRSRLPDAGTDAEGNLVSDNSPMVRQIQPIELTADFQLLYQRFGSDANPPGHKLISEIGDSHLFRSQYLHG